MMRHGFSLGVVIVLWALLLLCSSLPGKSAKRVFMLISPAIHHSQTMLLVKIDGYGGSSPRMTTEYALETAPAGLRAHPLFFVDFKNARHHAAADRLFHDRVLGLIGLILLMTRWRRPRPSGLMIVSVVLPRGSALWSARSEIFCSIPWRRVSPDWNAKEGRARTAIIVAGAGPIGRPIFQVTHGTWPLSAPRATDHLTRRRCLPHRIRMPRAAL